MENLTCRIFLAAQGNPTGVIQFPDSTQRSRYAEIARGIMSGNSSIEQFGFLEGTAHFQMSGGEFCGNAARVAALLISQQTGNTTGSFTMSGVPGEVRYEILPDGQVRCEFPGLSMQTNRAELMGGLAGQMVDMGGIVHVVLAPSVQFANDPERYQAVHADAVRELNLSDCPAVGVIWQEQAGQEVKIHPVVWVRDISSFFYETACGSGTLAVLEASGLNDLTIIQPSGKAIQAFRGESGYGLISEITEVE